MNYDNLAVLVDKLCQYENEYLKKRIRDIEDQSEEESDAGNSLYDLHEISRIFKCDTCDCDCPGKFTLEKHKNTKHSAISRPMNIQVLHNIKKMHGSRSKNEDERDQEGKI